MFERFGSIQIALDRHQNFSGLNIRKVCCVWSAYLGKRLSKSIREFVHAWIIAQIWQFRTVYPGKVGDIWSILSVPLSLCARVGRHWNADWASDGKISPFEMAIWAKKKRRKKSDLLYSHSTRMCIISRVSCFLVLWGTFRFGSKRQNAKEKADRIYAREASMHDEKKRMLDVQNSIFQS